MEMGGENECATTPGRHGSRVPHGDGASNRYHRDRRYWDWQHQERSASDRTLLIPAVLVRLCWRQSRRSVGIGLSPTGTAWPGFRTGLCLSPFDPHSLGYLALSGVSRLTVVGSRRNIFQRRRDVDVSIGDILDSEFVQNTGSVYLALDTTNRPRIHHARLPGGLPARLDSYIRRKAPTELFTIRYYWVSRHRTSRRRMGPTVATTYGSWMNEV
jgi:hypothetical protein